MILQPAANRRGGDCDTATVAGHVRKIEVEKDYIFLDSIVVCYEEVLSKREARVTLHNT